MEDKNIEYLKNFFSTFKEVIVEDKTNADGFYVVKLRHEIKVSTRDVEIWQQKEALKKP
jgi:hypothetical protein